MNTGDAEREFITFVRQNTHRLFAYTIRVCGNRWLAEDVLQDAFAKMWKAWPNKVNQGEAILSWAYPVIRRTAIDLHRKEERRKVKLGKKEHPLVETPWNDEKGSQIPYVSEIEEEAIFRGLAHELWAAVATLDPTQQDLIHLIYVEQMSLNRARQVLGLAGTTAIRYHDAALNRLREIIGGNE